MNFYYLVLLLVFAIPTFNFGQKPPNIILIMADDLGYEALSMYGNDINKSPNLERLASEGMLFQNCHSNPLCTPSRVQIMTGKYNFRNYVGFGILDPEETTFGHLFQSAGYQTCIAGKWQLYGYERQWDLAGGRKGTIPEDAGFDQYCLWQIHEVGSRYKNPRIHTKNEGLVTYKGKYGPDVFADFIEGFMEENSDGPFFVYYPMVLTHDPFEPTPELAGFKDYNPEQKVNDPKYFPTMVKYMDHIVGRIVKKTENLGIAENTLILFIGDNGTSRKVFSSVEGVEIQGDKGSTTSFGTHVPMIAYWPGHIKANSVHLGLIDFTDFVPTLLEVAGQKYKNRNLNLDGISFYPILMGKEKPKNLREWVFCHYDPNWGNRAKRRFVYDTNWKLYENGQIFNVSTDPHEENPLKLETLDQVDKMLILRFQKVLKRMR